MRTFIENYLHFIKNCVRPPHKKLKSLKSGFIENSNFENNRDPCYRAHIMKRISHLLWVVILAARPRGPPRVLRPPKELSHYIHFSSLPFTLDPHVVSTVTSSDSRGIFYHDQLHSV